MGSGQWAECRWVHYHGPTAGRPAYCLLPTGYCPRYRDLGSPNHGCRYLPVRDTNGRCAAIVVADDSAPRDRVSAIMDTPSVTPPALWDALLHRAPVHVFLFDSDLICRYAAPAGGGFLGKTEGQLVGRRAEDVLPPAENGLGPVLERAVRDREPWQRDEYRFLRPGDSGDAVLCWRVQVDPVEADGYAGVLVSVIDIERLLAERDELRVEIEQLRRADEERRRLLTELYTDLRTMLTPVSGYLQLIVRRPSALGGRAASEVIGERVLPSLKRMTGRLERVMQHPAAQPPSKDRDEPPSRPAKGRGSHKYRLAAR